MAGGFFTPGTTWEAQKVGVGVTAKVVRKKPHCPLFVMLDRILHCFAYSSDFIARLPLLSSIKAGTWCGSFTATSLSSAQFSRSVMSDSLRPHESQHARPPCPSPAPKVYSNSCPSSWWCHPAISSSVFPFSCCPQSLPASGSFPMSQLFAWGGQSTGVSASASVLPMNTQIVATYLIKNIRYLFAEWVDMWTMSGWMDGWMGVVEVCMLNS